MLTILLLTAGTGLILGLRFNVFILALLVLLVTISILATCIWAGNNWLVVALRLLATLGSVQISYLIGCLINGHIPARAKMAFGRAQYSRGPVRAVMG